MALLDLVCPTRCSGCGVAGSLVCRRCELVLTAPAICHVPTPCPAGMPQTWVVSAYDGPVRSMLLDFKERGAVGLARPLGDVVARCAAAAAPDPGTALLLVPVPSTPAAIRRRGDDVVRLLAEQASRRLRTCGRQAKVAAVLRQRRQVADSAGLSASARMMNLADALEVPLRAASGVRGSHIVIIDDLVTTGATLTTATGALVRAGAQVLGAAVVAATQRQRNW